MDGRVGDGEESYIWWLIVQRRISRGQLVVSVRKTRVFL